MTDDLDLDYRRWRHAEEDGDEDAADAAFASIFEATVSAPLPSPDFAAKTMAAVSAAAALHARRTRAIRKALLWGGVPALVVFLYVGAGALVSLASGALVGGLNLLVSAVVFFVSGSETGRPLWSVVSGLSRATAAFVADPRVTIAMVACQAMAVAALVALHRLLGSGREWLR